MILLTFWDLENPKISNKFQLISTPVACISRQDFFTTVFYFYLGGTDAGKMSSRKVAFNIAFKGTNRCGKFLSSFSLSFRGYYQFSKSFFDNFVDISKNFGQKQVKRSFLKEYSRSKSAATFLVIKTSSKNFLRHYKMYADISSNLKLKTVNIYWDSQSPISPN